MLYLGIDQHARQLTISLRDECGDVVQSSPQSYGTRLVVGCRLSARRRDRTPCPAGQLGECSHV